MELLSLRWQETRDALVSETPRETWPIASGVAAFWATLAMATFGQLKVLRISTGTRPPLIPSTLGMMSVCAASLASHQAAIAANRALLDYQTRRHRPRPESITTTLSKMKHQIPDNLQGYVLSSSPERTPDVRPYIPRESAHAHINVAGLVQVPTHTLRMYVTVYFVGLF